MKNCIIFAAGCGSPPSPRFVSPEDFVIAADGGYTLCKSLGITPSLAVGDWDSLGKAPTGCPIAALPEEKDDTDTLAAIRIGIEKGCTEFHIFGGTGGRPDHTIANMQCLVFLSKQGKKGFLYGDGTVITAITDRSAEFPSTASGGISVFAADGTAYGVSESGLKYSLDNAAVASDFPIGVSNAFTGQPSKITVNKGTLYIIFPKGVFPL